ncbi:hypothetical protein ES702_04222 [subsurface metagenome]
MNILEFLKPTLGKLTASIIFLLISPFLLWLLFLFHNTPVVNIFVFIVAVVLFLPPFLIIKALGLTTTNPAMFLDIGGPNLLGLIFIGLFDAVVLYLISCLVVHLKKRRLRLGVNNIKT